MSQYKRGEQYTLTIQSDNTIEIFAVLV